MNIEYMRTAKKSYMIVKQADFPFEKYELNMIRQNDFSCLLPFQMILSDGAAEYWYDVSGKQSLKTRLSLENMSGKQLRCLLESLIEMKSAMEEYLLDDANISFSAEMMYYDRSSERIRFCYIPGLGTLETSEPGAREAYSLKGLFEEILQHLNHADPTAVRVGYEMYERCIRTGFAMADCVECLQMGEETATDPSELSSGIKDMSWKHETMDIPDVQAADEDAEEIEFLFTESEPKTGHRRKRKKEPKSRQEKWPEAVYERRKEFGREKGKEKRRQHFFEKEPEEDELLFALRPDPPDRSEDISRTEVIASNAAAGSWELIYKGNGLESDLILTQFPFLIGTDRQKVDGALAARTVSRVHAKLYLKEEKLFVEDYNSTNGTYLNHRLLPMSTPTELQEGDRIVFATEEYAVYCKKAAKPPGF